jgi:hypothetical protein
MAYSCSFGSRYVACLLEIHVPRQTQLTFEDEGFHSRTPRKRPERLLIWGTVPGFAPFSSGDAGLQSFLVDGFAISGCFIVISILVVNFSTIFPHQSRCVEG